jgi:hypothetical protein
MEYEHEWPHMNTYEWDKLYEWNTYEWNTHMEWNKGDELPVAAPFHSIPFYSVPFYSILLRRTASTPGDELPVAEWTRCDLINKEELASGYVM